MSLACAGSPATQPKGVGRIDTTINRSIDGIERCESNFRSNGDELN
ncbi:hypothetical protein EGR_05888 [Echinococcus granulosus]|uniref:Uncharacterized protein n=1 Tax=Echinococcus granulosus TaxID=6210 RepID=W6UMD8_ECHGR|nr:hypothetical protein EGR_05888 [Echinococcus granulosus]EUB59287.1 hypothetical protein EGR_05888 [Echinococcus granulosus]